MITVIERPFTASSNRGRRISEGWSAAHREWEADKPSQPFSYRLKGKVGNTRPIPMTSVNSLAAKFYRLKFGHLPTGVFLSRFGHRDDDKCWRCGWNMSQTWEHLFRHCSRWKDQQKMLWKKVGQERGRKADRCGHVQASEICTILECVQAVMDCVAATEVRKFLPEWSSGMEWAQGFGLVGGAGGNGIMLLFLSLFLSFLCFLSFSHLSFVSGDEG